MRYANLNNSPRLMRVLCLLATGGEHSTLAIIRKAKVCAVSAIISELRENGYAINCQRRGSAWYYSLKTKDHHANLQR